MATEERLHAGMSTVPEPVRQPELGPLGWLRWGWRLLTSMRTALILLFLLAVGAVPGSLLPQRPTDPSKVSRWAQEHTTLFPIYDKLSLFDVFASPWFSAIYLLLFISLVGCVVPRSRLHWNAMRAKPPAAPRVFTRLPQHRSFETAVPPDVALAAAQRVLRRQRYRTVVGSDAVSAERGHLRETGNLLFHLSLIVILVGVAVGHLFGFRGNIVMVEGSSFANVDGAYDTFQTGPRFSTADLAPFTLTLKDFSVRYQQSGAQAGAPESFHAAVTYRTAPGEPLRRATIGPNEPLVVDGTKVFLTGNGYALRWTVRNAAGKVTFRGTVPFLPQDNNMTSNGVLKLPDASPRPLAITGVLLPTAALRDGAPASVFPDLENPQVLITAYTGDWGADDGSPQSVYSLDTEAPGLTQLKDPDDQKSPFTVTIAPGETQTLPGGNGTVTLDGIDRFVNFKIAKDPGTFPALVGAVLALSGLMGSLFVRRRRLWVRASAAEDGRTVIEVAGLPRTDEDGFAAHVDAVTEQLAAACAVPPAPARPAAPPSEEA